MNYAASMMRMGRRHDPDDSRVTNRLITAYAVLDAAGAKPDISHGTRTCWDWATNRDVHHCSLNGSGYGDCKIVWPDWVTDDMFDDAYAMASSVISARGTFHVNAATRAKAAVR